MQPLFSHPPGSELKVSTKTSLELKQKWRKKKDQMLSQIQTASTLTLFVFVTSLMLL